MSKYQQACDIVERIEKKRGNIGRHLQIIMSVLVIVVFLLMVIQGVEQFKDFIPTTIVITLINVVASGLSAIFDHFLSWRMPLLRGKSMYMLYVLEQIKTAEDHANSAKALGSGSTVDDICTQMNERMDVLIGLLNYENAMKPINAHSPDAV